MIPPHGSRVSRDHRVILYEYPFNERIRTYLRLEHLFGRLEQLMARNTPLDHHFALTTIFDVVDVSGRADLKSDVLKDLEKQKARMGAFRGNPAISDVSLNAVLGRLDDAASQLKQQHGKPGHELADDEWLMALRSRVAIAAGTCSFDLPAYHAWQHRPSGARRAHLEQWAGLLVPMANAIALLLQILRDCGVPQKVVAVGGQFQQTLPQDRTFQLLRLRVDEALSLVPEISGNRLMASVRMMRQDPDGTLHATREDAPFELALCA